MPNWGEISPPPGWGGVSQDRVIEWTPAEIRLIISWLSRPAKPPPPSPKKTPSRPPKKAPSPSPLKTSPGRRYDCQIRGCDHYSDTKEELWMHLESFHEIYEPPGWAEWELPHEPSPITASVSASRATTDSSTTPKFAKHFTSPATSTSISKTNTKSELNLPYPRATHFHKHRGMPKARLDIATEIKEDTGIRHDAAAIAKKLVEMYRTFTDTMDMVGVRNWGADAEGHVRYDHVRGKMRRGTCFDFRLQVYD